MFGRAAPGRPLQRHMGEPDGITRALITGLRPLILSSPVSWEKALYSELPKPTRFGDSIGHEVQKLSPDDNSQLAILGVIAKGVIGL